MTTVNEHLTLISADSGQTVYYVGGTVYYVFCYALKVVEWGREAPHSNAIALNCNVCNLINIFRVTTYD